MSNNCFEYLISFFSTNKKDEKYENYNMKEKYIIEVKDKTSIVEYIDNTNVEDITIETHNENNENNEAGKLNGANTGGMKKSINFNI